ncbi:hypothetical protein ARMGADRAFT_1092599 [Armillaria gallica]|uniref:Transmembrane protein n=1 Tax=Armillaria gallica TaxID=47427 RepID=A0A2H3CA66_ARMGA|nr:hypothetical protein ARMGADRAFT_1092599 [Armillaria gallica]
MFLPTALTVLAATASAQYIPIIAVPPDDDKSHQGSPKVYGIIVGCLFGLLFLGCCCEGIWRKHKLRRQAARQPDPEQPMQGSVAALSTAVPETDGEDKDNKESGDIDGKDSMDTGDGGSIFMVPVCPPPPAYTPKTDKIYKPLGGGEW